MSTIKLKPCPFCGGEAEVEREGTPRQSCIVSCTDCGCRLASNENGAGFHWNMRTRPDHKHDISAGGGDVDDLIFHPDNYEERT